MLNTLRKVKLYSLISTCVFENHARMEGEDESFLEKLYFSFKKKIDNSEVMN